ncbi:MAG TPA: cobyrinate a,c-diamide synthase, partial [Crinalium sp.]
DYIDPMFHRYVTGRACRNLDPILTSEAYVQQCFTQHSQDMDYALVEGVMGLFDGASGSEDVASTAHIARLLNLPVLLVLDCSRLSRSVAAIAHGYKTFDPRLNIAGVVLNRVGSDRHLDLLKSALEPLHLPILGVLRRQDDITIPDRHLGLVPTAELPTLNSLIDRLATLADHAFNWPLLLPLLKTESRGQRTEGQEGEGRQGRWGGWGMWGGTCFPISPTSPNTPITPTTHPPLKIAVARDRAFSFYYPDNLDILESLGAELVFWSPLSDTKLPEQLHGLYLGGGFPEVFAAELADNAAARAAVRQVISGGMPTYAECGGLMYLSQQIIDFEGQSWPMVGVLPTTAKMGGRLTLGYRQAIALQETPLVDEGTTVWGHEFHRSSLSDPPEHPLYQVRGYDPQGFTQGEGWKWQQVHASYVHLHWGTTLDIPTRFVKHCREFAHQLSKFV